MTTHVSAHRAATPHRMRRTLTTLALTLAGLTVAAAAQAGVLPGPTHGGTNLGVTCTVQVIDSHVNVFSNAATAPVRVVVTNNARTKTVDFRDYLTDHRWTHGVWHTYTDANVRAWVQSRPCTAK